MSEFRDDRKFSDLHICDLIRGMGMHGVNRRQL